MTCLLTPFKEQHLLELDYQEPLKVSRDTLFSLGRFYSHWPAWSALRDDKVIGSAGMYYVAPGHFAAWAALSTELLCDYPLWLHRQIVKGLNEAVAFLPARRGDGPGAVGHSR